MTLERALRGAAGALVLIALALAQLHSVYWLALTGLVGLNLLQSHVHRLVSYEELPALRPRHTH